MDIITRIQKSIVRRWYNHKREWMSVHASDASYLKYVFKHTLGYELNLDNPKTLNEKLQWLKLESKNHPEYTQMVDKVAAKDFIADRIGKEYVVPTLGVWNSVDEIDWQSLPNQFVLKAAGDSGGIVVCTDKSKLDIKASVDKLRMLGERDYCKYTKEYPYRDVPHRYIAEKYLVDESGTELKDYKVFCFNGKPEYIEVDFNRWIEHKLNPYDFDWNPLNFCDKSQNDYSANIPKPQRLKDMYNIAAELSKDMKFLRVDFYSIYDKIYVGELTLFPGTGMIDFNPKDRDLYYGEKLNLNI